MVGRGLNGRVEALEQREGVGVITRWHWLIGEPGETKADARARYERDECPIGEGEGVIFWNEYTDNGMVPE